jgi:plasmid stability protein
MISRFVPVKPYPKWSCKMPDILVRDIDPEKLELLKARAKKNGRSLQSEAKLLIEKAAEERTNEEVLALLETWKKQFSGRKFSISSVDLIREDRDR